MMTIHIHKPVAITSRSRALLRWLDRMVARWMHFREVTRTMRALHTLPDSALRDIGLHRSEIRSVATFKRLNHRS